jgi:YbgC/YbaW family acyl-CoA thioester hydrolase
MTATTVRMHLRVRGSELGPGGVILASHVSRYLEQARWQAFEAPSFVLTGKLLGGVVRAQTIEMEEELRYGEAVEVTTWLARVGRTSLDFGHLIAREDGVRVAVARCTIVQLGPDGPAPLDPELASLTVDLPLPAHEALRNPPEGDLYELPFIVRPTDTDSFSHVNQARYVDFAEDARILADRADHPAGVAGRLRRISVEYVREARAGDSVTIRLGVDAERGRSLELVRGDEVLTRMWARYG